MTLVLTEQKMPFSRVLNLIRGDVIVNGSRTHAEVILTGLGRIIIPAGGRISLLRKGAELIGNWRVRMDLFDGRVTITLEAAYDEEDDGS